MSAISLKLDTLKKAISSLDNNKLDNSVNVDSISLISDNLFNPKKSKIKKAEPSNRLVYQTMKETQKSKDKSKSTLGIVSKASPLKANSNLEQNL